MKKIYLFLLLLLAVYSSNAQSNYKSGFVITSKGDTVKGYIDYREWDNNPDNIRFKTAPADAHIQNYTPADIRLFKITGMEYYESHVVKISLDKTDVQEISTGADTSSKTANVFLRVLKMGSRLTLYSYIDNIKTRFYIQDKPLADPTELIYKSFLDPEKTGKIFTKNTFKGQLIAAAGAYQMDSPALINKINYASYRAADLIAITVAINGIDDKKTAQSSERKTVRMFIGGGINAAALQYSGSIALASNPQSKTSYFPRLSVGADGFINPNVGTLFARIELAFTGSNLSTTGTTGALDVFPPARQQVKQYTASLIPQLFYNIYNTEATKVFLGVGMAYNFSANSSNQYISTNIALASSIVQANYPALSTFWVNFPVKAGLTLHQTIEIYGAYLPSASATNYDGFSGNITTYQIGFNYLFGKTR